MLAEREDEPWNQGMIHVWYLIGLIVENPVPLRYDIFFQPAGVERYLGRPGSCLATLQVLCAPVIRCAGGAEKHLNFSPFFRVLRGTIIYKWSIFIHVHPFSRFAMEPQICHGKSGSKPHKNGGFMIVFRCFQEGKMWVGISRAENGPFFQRFGPLAAMSAEFCGHFSGLANVFFFFFTTAERRWKIRWENSNGFL